MDAHAGHRIWVTFMCPGCSNGLTTFTESEEKRPGDTIICNCGRSCVVEEAGPCTA